MNETGEIYGVNGPILNVRGFNGFFMSEMVFVTDRKLLGEVISMDKDAAVVQVFEDTSMLKRGEPVYPTGRPLSVTLAPGIIGSIFDGIQRPLSVIEETCGPFIPGGAKASALDENKLWDVTFIVKTGDTVTEGMIIGEVPETASITHRILVPVGVAGEIVKLAPNGRYTIIQEIAVVQDAAGVNHSLTLKQEWPIRIPRPVAGKMTASKPLITGQRVVDTMFPIAKGGAAALPGGFGTGKTMTQHQLAKWSDADIILYIGCGERGNEMTQALEEFSELTDPRSGARLLDRTILIANTSNMPVAAREASIFTGITMAEYYRDMGLHVALMADSTSRWAEALREIGGRLEEMPAEEGFPAYLASRLAAFYERAGYVKALSGKEGSVTVIGAVSPQGADFSEPVTQNTKRFVRCFWALDRSLAYARHFPAIHWLDSYSEYLEDLEPWYRENVSDKFLKYRAELLKILNEENNLMEIVKLVGADVLPEEQKLTLEIARVIRLGFAQQNAYHAYDTYVPLEKQLRMMEVILKLRDACQELIGVFPLQVLKESDIFEKVVAIKYNVGNDELDKFNEYKRDIDEFYESVSAKN